MGGSDGEKLFESKQRKGICLFLSPCSLFCALSLSVSSCIIKNQGCFSICLNYVTFWHELTYLQQPKKISIHPSSTTYPIQGERKAWKEGPMVDGVFMLAVFNITSSGACYRTICIHLKEAQYLSFSEYCSGFLCVNSRHKEKWLRDDVAVVRVYWRLKGHDTPWTCHQSIAGLEYASY